MSFKQIEVLSYTQTKDIIPLLNCAVPQCVEYKTPKGVLCCQLVLKPFESGDNSFEMEENKVVETWICVKQVFGTEILKFESKGE